MKTFLYWLVSLTWGGIMTFIGLCAALGMLITFHKPHRYGHAIYFESRKKGWGGVNLGAVFIVSKGSGDGVKSHEYGHSFQNIFYGIGHVGISIASFTRYWYRVYLEKKYPFRKLPPYDSVWFEAQATEWGMKYSPFKIN